MNAAMLKMVRDSTKRDVKEVRLQGGKWQALIDGVWHDASELMRVRNQLTNVETKTGTTRQG